MATAIGASGVHAALHADADEDVASPAMVTTSDEGLTADFRAQLGLLLDDDEGLTEVFKARIGLLGDEALCETSEVEMARTEEHEQTLSKFKYRAYANDHFHNTNTNSFNPSPLAEPLLVKGHRVDKLASLAVWMAIQRYMGDIPTPKDTSTKIDQVPVMTKLYSTLDKHLRRRDRKDSDCSNGEPEKDIVSFKLKKRQSWKKFFGQSTNAVKKNETCRSSSTNQREFEYSSEPQAILELLPVRPLDLIHFIVGHGILRREMRDEIFCQLCKQLTDNPSRESSRKGWILMAFCTGCFKPSEQFRKQLKTFLNDASPEFRDRAIYAHRLLRRSFANGTRFHPPNWLECQATEAKQFVVLPVSFANGHVESIEVDAATTSTEMCSKLANKIGLKDLFGFSIFVSIFHKVSSLGSGVDHVMDAISECEQVSRAKGKKEEDATWRLYFRKELFAPWNDPTFDEVAATLIYEQLCKGIRSQEYAVLSEDDLVKFAARRYFVENGSPLQTSTLQSKLDRYLPKTALSGGRPRDGWIQAITASFAEQKLADGGVTAASIREKMVLSAPHRWPVHFSALFVAFKLAGPRLPKNEVVIAVGGEGFFVLDRPFHVILALHFYDIVEVFSSRAGKVHGQSFNMVTVKGDEFTFASPNAEIITQLIMFFLNGLRRRSIYAVGLDNFIAQAEDGVSEPLRFHQGDLIKLLDNPPGRDMKEDWCHGECERTATRGIFPIDLIYILPICGTPPEEFLNAFRLMSTKNAETLPRKRASVFISKGTIGRHAIYGKDSAA